MQLYHFTTADYALSNIKLRRLKIARLEDLNDPFEWLAPACVNPVDQGILQGIRQQMHEDSGLICFSEECNNPVLWGHYADRHRGICLGFDVHDAVAAQVIYATERTKVDNLGKLFASEPDPEAWMKREVILRKFLHWQYEKEWRTFIKLDRSTIEDANYFFDFGPRMKLNAVLLGPKCVVKKIEVDEAIGDLPGVRVLSTSLAPMTFSVCPENHLD